MAFVITNANGDLGAASRLERRNIYRPGQRRGWIAILQMQHDRNRNPTAEMLAKRLAGGRQSRSKHRPANDLQRRTGEQREHSWLDEPACDKRRRDSAGE